MQWYEERGQYSVEAAIPPQVQYDKLSLVRVYPNGKTQPGWGAHDFMDNYLKNAFDPERSTKFFRKYGLPFGIMMRSLPWVCVDIDGKNGGIETARAMHLPPTFAEVSKSENGFHLFYAIPEMEWDKERGYTEFPDIIKLIPGVDLKGTGVVFHYPNQRWNHLDVAEAPPSLLRMIRDARAVKRAMRSAQVGVANLEPEELVIIHDELKTDLAGRFPVGGRNQKLFAIGAQMFAAGYPAWDVALYDRGLQIGLDLEEVGSIIKHIEEYS